MLVLVQNIFRFYSKCLKGITVQPLFVYNHIFAFQKQGFLHPKITLEKLFIASYYRQLSADINKTNFLIFISLFEENFQYVREPVLLQRILKGIQSIQEKRFNMKTNKFS